MRALLVRLALLTGGMAAIEIGLASGPAAAPLGVTALVVIGIVSLVAGSAGFMVPLFSGARNGRIQ